MKMIYRSKLGCRISPYRKRQSAAVEQNTALYDKVYHEWNEYTGFCLPYRGNLTFMTYNRDYSDLVKMFPTYKIEKMECVKSQRFTSPIHLKNVDSFWTAQSQIIGKIEATRSDENVWFVNLQTGQGKTLLTTYISTELNLKTWVLCYSDDILEQWYETYCTKTDIDEQRIIRVTGQIIDKMLAGEMDPSVYDIFMCTPTLLDRFGSRRSDYSRIEDLFNLCGIGFMIYDEAHRNVSNIVKLNAAMDVRYQVYLSADFGQGAYEKEQMYREIFKDVPVLKPTKDVRLTLKYTKIVVVNYNTYPNEIEKQEPFNKYGYSAELYMQYQFKKGIIEKAIIYILNTFLVKDPNYRALILFTNIRHVEAMNRILQKEFPDLNIGMYYGNVSPQRKEAIKQHAKIIIATYSSFSTGLDVKDIKYVISTNQCNKIADNQSAGRARALSDGSDALYFMLVDNGFSYCKRKLKIRLSYLSDSKAKNDMPYSFWYHPDIHAKGENK